MKMLILKQAKIENESEPKVITLGNFAINPEDIVMVHDVMDKYDCIIKGVIGIRTKQGEGVYIAGTFNTIMELLEQDTFA